MLSLLEVAKFFIRNMYLNAVIILCIELLTLTLTRTHPYMSH
jgi:hypothetical protein